MLAAFNFFTILLTERRLLFVHADLQTGAKRRYDVGV
jgi:hypothetical protein